MRKRAKVWAARAILWTLVASPLVGLYFIRVNSQVVMYPAHEHHLLVLMGEGLSVGLALCLGASAVGLVAADLVYELRLLSYVARRKAHPPWRHRWQMGTRTVWDHDSIGYKTTPRYKGQLVTYDTPPPLVRGRIGSR